MSLGRSRSSKRTVDAWCSTRALVRVGIRVRVVPKTRISAFQVGGLGRTGVFNHSSLSSCPTFAVNSKHDRGPGASELLVWSLSNRCQRDSRIAIVAFHWGGSASNTGGRVASSQRIHRGIHALWSRDTRRIASAYTRAQDRYLVLISATRSGRVELSYRHLWLSSRCDCVDDSGLTIRAKVHVETVRHEPVGRTV